MFGIMYYCLIGVDLVMGWFDLGDLREWVTGCKKGCGGPGYK